jgi:hypothetical protein
MLCECRDPDCRKVVMIWLDEYRAMGGNEEPDLTGTALMPSLTTRLALGSLVPRRPRYAAPVPRLWPKPVGHASKRNVSGSTLDTVA